MFLCPSLKPGVSVELPMFSSTVVGVNGADAVSFDEVLLLRILFMVDDGVVCIFVYFSVEPVEFEAIVEIDVGICLNVEWVVVSKFFSVVNGLIGFTANSGPKWGFPSSVLSSYGVGV